jgi:parallel beta-helix repeat protein
LTSDIIDYAGTCIDNPENFTNKTFDCQGHIIKGDDLGADYGIYLNGKTNNTIRNCIITDFAYGILLSSSNYSTITNNTVNNNSYYGIYLSSSSNYSTITNNTVNNNNNIGIYLSSSSNNTITNNTASNNNYGIYLDSSSSYNTITNNTAINNTQWDFYSTSDSLDNTVTNLNISFVISFTSNAIALKSATAPAPDPAGYTDISKYINATNTAAGGWLFLNISYDDAELGDIDESTLRIWKYNGSWYSCSVFASECGVDTVNNVVYANITSFSIFAPLGTPSMICTCDSCSDCMAKLNDPACMEVRLTTEIIDYAGTCIDSPANFINKIFDCQGHIIDGTGSGWAISLDGKNNNTIKNCIISEFGGGIYLVSSRYNNFTNNTIKNNVNYGFYLYSFSDANDIINNTISNNSIGVYIFNPWSNAIINNTIINHTNSGIYLKATQYTSIEGNTITNNNKGIYLEGNSDITMTKNTANNNNYGIYLFDAHRTVSVDTVAIGNGYDLYLAFSDATFNNTITGLNLYFADSGSNFSNLTLNASHGSIVYNNLTIDQYENTVNNINIGYNLISLASENIPNFNRSATLNFYNVTGIVTPIAIRNGVVCGDLCSDVVDLGNNNYQFNVSYFTNYSIGGLPSIPQLYKPAPEAQLYDRTPLFEWFNSTDASSYDLLVANASNFEQASIIINQTGIPEGSGNHSEDWSNLTSYEALVALPVDKILYWKVRACNLYTCSQWSEVRNFTILSSLIVTLVVDNVNFGTMLPNEENDTEDNAPSPLLIQNDGNVIVDIIVTGTDLWQTKPNPSSYYQYKAGINESNSFNETISTMTWTNMSSTNTFVDIADLKYVDESDTAEVELKIKVPPDEPAGSRNSTITITAQSAE